MIGRFVYVIGDEGAVDIFRMRDPNHYDHVGRTNTAAGARTGLFVCGKTPRLSNRTVCAVAREWTGEAGPFCCQRPAIKTG
jgi:hypothetical protein